MIKKIRIKNFKCYGPRGADFNLSRVNFIFGDNSAGKSTFLQFVAKIDEVCGLNGCCAKDELDGYLFRQEPGVIAAKIRVSSETDQTEKDEVWDFRLAGNNKDEYELVDATGLRVGTEKLARILPVKSGARVVHVEANRKTFSRASGESRFLQKFSKQAAIETSDIEREYINDILKRLGVSYTCVVDTSAQIVSSSYIHDNVFDIDLSLADVGTGIDGLMQLALTLNQWKGGILAIEEPETNINEKQMAALTKVLVEEAIRRESCQLIVECHSELMFLELRNMLAHGVLKPEDISIIVVMRDKDGSVSTKIDLDEFGNLLTPWPGGFFPERVNITDAYYQN